MLRYTPENIDILESNEVIIFGSNLGGQHLGGAAKQAYECFGAVSGVGEGLRGQSYAFPTLDKEFRKLTITPLTIGVNRLIRSARENPDKVFLLTRVGCGIAGYNESFMIKLFDRADMPKNIIKPKEW